MDKILTSLKGVHTTILLVFGILLGLQKNHQLSVVTGPETITLVMFYIASHALTSTALCGCYLLIPSLRQPSTFTLFLPAEVLAYKGSTRLSFSLQGCAKTPASPVDLSRHLMFKAHNLHLECYWNVCLWTRVT